MFVEEMSKVAIIEERLSRVHLIQHARQQNKHLVKT